MKKVVFIVICIVGIVSISSCKSTAKSCGLADNLQTDQEQYQESEEMMFV